MTPTRSRLLPLLSLAAFLLVGLAVVATAPDVRAGSGTGPDVTVIYLPGTSHYTDVSFSGIHAYAVGTTSCNLGTEPLSWCDDFGGCTPGLLDNEHPVIAQNMYRLKDDRFEQVGMSWLKHGFLSLNTPDASCGSCQSPPGGGNQLGVGCTDAYSSGLNGSRSELGPRSEVQPTSGSFSMPFANPSTLNQLNGRIQVAESDLDPTLNAGARYFVEGHYIAADDAAEGNALNNASYREVTIQADYDLTMVGGTIRELPAIAAWSTIDSDVDTAYVDIASGTPGVVERFHAARKVVPLGGGVWHYEYAIFNMNSRRAGQALSVSFPASTPITNMGFRDVDHHSGEPYATTDWAMTSDTTSATWATSLFSDDNDANALRWGTLYSFWMDAEAGPNQATETLVLFEPGSPGSVEIPFGLFVDGFESEDTSAWASTVP